MQRLLEPPSSTLPEAQGRGDLGHHQRGVGDRGEIDDKDAVGETLRTVSRASLPRSTGLGDTEYLLRIGRTASHQGRLKRFFRKVCSDLFYRAVKHRLLN